MQEVKFSINPTLSMFDNGFDDDGNVAITESTKERLGYFLTSSLRHPKRQSGHIAV